MKQHPQAIFQQAVAEYNQNRNEQVVALLKPLLKSQGKNKDVLTLHASALVRLGKSKDAIKIAKQALKLDSKSARAHQALGGAYLQQSLTEMAYDLFEKAFKYDPRNPRPLMEIALSLQEQERWTDAERLVDRFLKAGGDPIEGNIRKGVCRYSLYDYTAARELLDKVEAMRPGLDIVQYYRAQLLDKTDKKEEAEALFLDLINNKKHEPSLFSLSLLYFSIGRWTQAFELYENRSVAKNLKRFCAEAGVKAWDSQEPFAGKHVLVKEEQGLGDQIRYLYFLPMLLAEAEKVSVYCDSRLYPLIQSSFPQVSCVQADSFSVKMLKHVNADVTVCMGSLGLRFGSELPKRQLLRECSAHEAAFLKPDETLVKTFEEQLPDNGKLNIGISWRSIRFMKERNEWYLSAKQMASVFKGLDVNLISLQYALNEEESQAFKDAGLDLLALPDLDLKDDQAGLAALMSELDGVVSVSTALSELSGAMGVPSVIFVVENIRWFMSEAHIRGFYPNTKLVSKEMFSEWDKAIEEAATLVRALKH